MTSTRAVLHSVTRIPSQAVRHLRDRIKTAARAGTGARKLYAVVSLVARE